MKEVQTSQAPSAIGPYSQAIAHNGFLYVSGQLPLDPVSGAIVGDDAATQIVQCLANIRAIVQAAGSDMNKAVKTTVLMTDLAEFSAVNEAYGQFFHAPYPARATYQVAALPRSARVEVEAIFAFD